jgi:hypothetical protein
VSKCSKAVIDRIVSLVERNQPWSSIAKAMGISERMLRLWRQEGSEYYEPDFAGAVQEARQRFEDDQIHRIKTDQFEQARKHKLIKVTKELKVDKFKMPPAWFPKAYIIDYADQILDLTLWPNMTVKEMRAECFLRIKELNTEELVVTKREEVEVDPNAQAVKNVSSNAGTESERWRFDTNVKHGVDENLAEFLKSLEE